MRGVIMNEFASFFNNKDLQVALKQDRTLVKGECEALFEYMKQECPKTILEFGTKYGCSTRFFVEAKKWLNLDTNLHSWDIVDSVRPICVNKQDFNFHLEDMTGKEDEIFDKYDPDFLFLDGHAYSMTRRIMIECLKRKINFSAHDVYDGALVRAKKRTNNFSDFSVYVNWEIYLIGDLISKDLWEKQSYEDEFVRARRIITPGGCGIAMVEVKKENMLLRD